MLGFLRSAKKAFVDRDVVVAVPAMDGPYKPNNHLEQAERLFTLPEVDNLALAAGAAYCTSGPALYRVDLKGSTRPSEIKRFDAPIVFVAAGADDRLIVGVDSDGIHSGAGSGQWRRLGIPPALAACMTAGTLLPDGGLSPVPFYRAVSV